MSKGFYYNYKDELTEKLEKKYKKKLDDLIIHREKQAQLDVAQETVENYFNIIEKDLSDIIMVSNGGIKITKYENVIIRFSMFQNYIKFTRFNHAIEVEIGEYDNLTGIIEAKINSNIIPSDKKCVVKKIGKVHDGSHFDLKTINYYMNEAFGGIKELNI